MTNSIQQNSESLKKAYNYYSQGKIHDMEQLLNTLSQNSFTKVDDKLTYDVLSCYQLLLKSDYEKCVQDAKALLMKCEEQGNFIQFINTCTILAETYEWTGKYKDAIEFIEKGEQKLSNLRNLDSIEKIQKKVWLTHFRGRIAWWQGDFDNAQKFFEETLTLSKETNIDYDIAMALQNIGLIGLEKSDYEGSLKYHKEALQKFQKIGNKYRLGWCLQNLGGIEEFRGNYDSALSYLKESLKYREEVGNKVHISFSIGGIGNVYSEKGDLNLALEYYQKCLSLREEMGNKTMIIMSNVSLASIYRRKGDLEKAFEYLHKSKALIDDTISKRNLLIVTFNFALAYWMKDEIEKSINTVEENLSFMKESGVYINDILFSNVYLWMVIFALDIDNLNKANKYRQLQKELLDKASDKILIRLIKQNYELMDALLLKKSSRIRDKVKAQDFLEKIIEDDTYSSSFKEMSMINLCDLLIDELKIYGDPSVLEEINELVGKLYTLSQNQGSFSLMTNTLIIQSKLALIEGNISRSEQLLEQAKLTTEEKGLNLLEEKVIAEQNFLDTQYQTWKKMIDGNVSFGERLERVKFTDYLKEAIKYVKVSDIDK